MTSGTDDDIVIQLMLTEPRIAKLTEAAVANALDGFPLHPEPDTAWLARAIQGALYVSLVPASENAERQSNAETRDELNALASKIENVWLSISARSSAADTAIWDYAWRSSIRETPVDDDVALIDPPANKAFNHAVGQLDWLGSFLRRSADLIAKQGPGWRQSERREERIMRAQCLSPVFERAFGLQPTVNTWPNAKSLGPWPDFYQRIVALAFGEASTPNLEEVLDEARRRDKAQRVSFAPGVIPD